MSNYNLSLDDIIKRNKRRNPQAPRRGGGGGGVGGSRSNKNNKSAAATATFRSNAKKKQNLPVFKSKFRKRKAIAEVQDARVKILQNKKRLQAANTSKPNKPNKPNPFRLYEDARMKIESRRHTKMVDNFVKRRGSVPSVPSSVGARGAVTSMNAEGLLQRRINRNSILDSGVRVEYEDDDMNLENEVFNLKSLPNKFTIRRTVHNSPERKYKSPLLYNKEERSGFRSADHDELPYYDSKDNISLNEVTRTITNYIKQSPSSRKNFPKRVSSSPPPRQSPDQEMRDLSAPGHSWRDPPCHRITISNLHENVTGEDIKELFEDVGDLVYAKMVKAGIAEVAYKSRKDAISAVDIYHNRQLDGLPMRCKLLDDSDVKKHSSSRIPPVNTFQSVEPDAHIIKKALFSN